MSPTTYRRLFSRVAFDPNGCWLWTGATNSSGYGYISVGKGRVAGVHRVSYELFYGPIPAGYETDHLCNRRRCVNPIHIQAVTREENVRRIKRRRPLRLPKVKPPKMRYCPPRLHWYKPAHATAKCPRCIEIVGRPLVRR